MRRKALITGITGQDGSYLAEFLLAHDYEVHGIIRRASSFNTRRIDHIYEDPHGNKVALFLHYGDLGNSDQLTKLICEIEPDEIYNLGAQSHVGVSFKIPEYTGNVTGLGILRLLEAVRESGGRARLYQASSSEMFGTAPAPQSETTQFHPRSPYGVAKTYAHWMTINYRESYNLHLSCGILFNHESPRRGETFVTRKITRAVALIKSGKQKVVYLGNLDARRDWGYAPEYVEGMWRIVQQETPEDYVLGTGESHSVREFVEEAFSYVGLDWQSYVQIDPRYQRPAEVHFLRANSDKAKRKLHWKPKITFRQLVRIMVDADMEMEGMVPPGEGKAILKESFALWHQWEGAVSQMIASRQGAADEL